MSNTPKRDNAGRAPGKVGKTEISNPNRKPPLVTGQCGQVHGLIQQYQPLLSLRLTADYAITEAAARIHDLRAMGFNNLPEVEYRGAIQRNVALYSLGSPEWPGPGFFENEELSK